MEITICTPALLHMAGHSDNQCSLCLPSVVRGSRALNSHDSRFMLPAYCTQFVLLSPVLHVLMVRVLTSGMLWKNYHHLGFFVNLPLPLQILGIRFLMKVSLVL